MRSIKHACVNMVLVVVSLIVAILLCEGGLRVVGFTNPGDFKIPLRGMAPRFYYETHPTMGHDLVKNFAPDVFLLPDYIRTHGAPFSVSSNSVGCRDRPFDSEDGYVLLIGDSYTWGYTALEQTWGATLEQLVDRRVLKCGVPGYGPRQQRHKLDAVVTQSGQPRLVIVGYVMNDLLDDYLYPSRTVTEGFLVNKTILANTRHGEREIRSDHVLQERLKNSLNAELSFSGRVKGLLARYSILYDRVTNAEVLRPVTSRLGIAESLNPLSDLEAFRSPDEFPWLRPAWDEHLENLRQLKSAVEELGATMLVVIFPDARQVYDALRPSQGNFQWEHPNQRLMEFFQRERIAAVDLLPEFRRYANCSGGVLLNTQEDLYWAHDDHPNVRGNRVAGLLIGRHILEQSWLPVANTSGRLSELNRRLNSEAQCRSTTSPLRATTTTTERWPG